MKTYKIVYTVFSAFLLCFIGCFTNTHSLLAQTDTEAVKTIEGITDKMLELISVEIGEDSDWEEFRTLFLPTAQFLSFNPTARSGRQTRAFNIEEFIRLFGPMYKKEGFLETATGIQVQEFNGLANVFQSFEAKNLTGTYAEKGINSYQLVYLNDRWWIANSTWVNASETRPIPNEFLDTPAPSTQNKKQERKVPVEKPPVNKPVVP